jgi:DNA-binding SARP family transcriptional activator
LQGHVLRLRRALGDSRIVTQGGGYRLVVQPGELDADRLERAVADGEPERLREALSLWRGPPLPELAEAPFARGEIARLEDLRLTALELRIEAELALGRHAQLVSSSSR